MKQLVVFLLLVFLNQSYAQTIDLQGRYGASFIGAETIEFVGKDSFYFSGFYCTYGVHGKGRCEIRGNYLHLFFEKSKEEKKVLKAPVIDKTPNTDSFFDFQLTMVDENDIPIPFGSVVIERGYAGKIGMTSSELGSVKCTRRINNFPIIVKTSSIGFEPGYLELESGFDYSIKLFHRKDTVVHKELNKGEVLVYEIDELYEDLIVMRPEKSTEYFRRYRKKND